MTDPTDAADPTDPAAPPRRRATTSIAVTALGAVLGLGAAALVVRELVVEWGPASDAIAGASIGWLVLAVVAGIVGMAAIAWVWADVLAVLGVSVERSRVMRWYFVGELGKYLPGGVWTVVGRAELARRGGIARPTSYGSVALSLVTLYVAAAITAALLLPFDLAGQADDPRVAIGALVVIAAGALLLHPRTVAAGLTLARRLSGRALPIDLPTGHTTAVLIVRYVPAWVGIGVATWAIARALDPGASLPRVMLAATVSWIAGFLAVPVPAGGGVREAVFLAVAGLPAGVGAATAVAARVLFIAIDAGGAAIASASARRARTPSPVSPRPGDVE